MEEKTAEKPGMPEKQFRELLKTFRFCQDIQYKKYLQKEKEKTEKWLGVKSNKEIL